MAGVNFEEERHITTDVSKGRYARHRCEGWGGLLIEERRRADSGPARDLFGPVDRVFCRRYGSSAFTDLRPRTHKEAVKLW